jgi:hypothetical protein
MTCVTSGSSHWKQGGGEWCCNVCDLSTDGRKTHHNHVVFTSTRCSKYGNATSTRLVWAHVDCRPPPGARHASQSGKPWVNSLGQPGSTAWTRPIALPRRMASSTRTRPTSRPGHRRCPPPDPPTPALLPERPAEATLRRRTQLNLTGCQLWLTTQPTTRKHTHPIKPKGAEDRTWRFSERTLH